MGMMRAFQSTPATPVELSPKAAEIPATWVPWPWSSIGSVVRSGDFIVQRADGLCAYQLAAVVDDAELGITDVVRGSDLMDSSLRQVYLQQLLGLKTPRYLHLPVVVNAAGEKLSKQTLAPALDLEQPQQTIIQALSLLNQSPPQALAQASVAELLYWAIQRWNPASLPPVRILESPVK